MRPTVGLSIAAGLAVILGSAATALATFPGENGRIAFSRDSGDETLEIYSASPRGRHLRQLTDAPGNSVIADWTPDGRMIVFDSDRVTKGCDDEACNVEIFIMDADGSNETRLTHNPTFDGGPAVSPDGQWIAFESFRAGHSDLFLMRIDGSHLVQLTDDEPYDLDPTWSPDGRWLAFVSNREADRDSVYKMRVDGSHLSRVTPLRLRGGAPDWSPDGEEIVFANNADVEGTADIFTIDADGSDLTRLTQLPEEESYFYPSWSPNGRKIAVNYFTPDAADVVILSARTGRLLDHVTNDPTFDLAPDWGPRA